MKKVFRTFLSVTVANLLLLLTPSCSGLATPSAPDAPEAQRYTLSGSFSMPYADAAPAEVTNATPSARNAVPDMSGLTYTVEAVRSDGHIEITTSEDHSTYTFTNRTAGSWQITAYAKTSGGTSVMQSETKSVTLSKSKPDATTSLAMEPASGRGEIDLIVSWTNDSGIGYCEWAFSGSGSLSPSGTSTTSPITIRSSSVASGTHPLTLKFFTSQTNANNGSKPLYSCTEYVSVYAGLETNSWTSDTAQHLGAGFSVTKECVETFIYRTIYVKQGADDSTATGTTELPFGTIEKAMERLNEVAAKGIRASEISETTPWELHVTGTITATDTITGDALIAVDDTIAYLAIIGEGSGATIDADDKGTIVYVGGDASVSMQTITLKNGYDPSASSAGGGGVYVDSGTFTMNSGAISSNQTVYGNGGGIYVAGGGTFVMNGGTISANKAANGNGVHVSESGIFTMNGGTISANTNTSTYEGGGVYCDGIFTMTDGTITGNTATKGKGVYIDANGEFTMNGGSITSNTGSTGSGGGVYTCGTFTMNNGTISANSATGGNGVCVNSGTFTMNGGTISANSGNFDSGAVYVQTGASFTMNSGSTISGNQNIGGVYIGGSGESGGGSFTMNGGTISGNTANDGGGVYVGNGATFNMTDGTIKGNSAAKGGGVYSAGNFTMSGGTIGGTNAEDANKAQGDYKQGGGVYVNMNTFEMTGGTIEGNTVDAGGQGTGVYVDTTPTFKMEGNARVAPSNNVYLCYGRKITISDTITATNPAATITPAICTMNVTVLGGTAALIEANRTKFALSDSTYTINKDGNVWKDNLASLTLADMQTLIASPDAKTSSDLIMTPSSEHGSWQWIHMIGTKYVVKTTAGRYCTLEITGISDDNVWVHTEVRPAGEETVHSWSFYGNDSDIDAVLGGESGNQNAKNDIHVDNGTPHNSAKFYIMEYVYNP